MTTSPRMFLSWAARHGLVKIALSRAARRGDPQAVMMIDREVRADPFPLYEQIRSRGPISRGGLSYVAPSREAASAVLRSEAFRVGVDLTWVPPVVRKLVTRRDDDRIVGPIEPPSLLAVNPPEHTRYRRQVAKVFTPRAIAALEPRVRQIADKLLDDLHSTGAENPGQPGRPDQPGQPGQPDRADRADRAGTDRVDLVSRYASLLPVTVIAEILGVPVGMSEQFLKWGHDAGSALDIGISYHEYRNCERGIRALDEWMYGHIDRLRRSPGDDLLSQLIMVEDDGLRMTDLELMSTASLLLAAGFETTVNLIGSGAQLLLTHQDQLQILQADPSLWENAVDEILRFESPVQNTARYAAHATEICGLQIPKYGFVQILLGAANRDPQVYTEPDRFDVRRPNARDHLAFSAGVHFCLGAALARTEGRIGLQALFERYPELAPAGTPTRRRTRTLRGYEVLPVRTGRPQLLDPGRV